MASSTEEVVVDFFPIVRLYKNGRLERFTESVPASLDCTTAVQSKDVQILPKTGIGARLYIPKTVDPLHKLPLVVYFHGGRFVAESASSRRYHAHLNSLVAEASIVAVSVDYRLAPEHPLPAAYEDSWAAIQWVASHSTGGGDEPWLNQYADFERVFFAGDSAGGNIAHNMGIRVGSEKSDGSVTLPNLVGILLVHPYFGGVEPIGAEGVNMEKKAFCDKLWVLANPAGGGLDDPWFNPGLDPKLWRLGCLRVMVCVAEKDILRDRGWYYYEVLGKSGWGGEVEVMEAKGEDHVFHLFNPTCQNAATMLKRMASFINLNKA